MDDKPSKSSLRQQETQILIGNFMNNIRRNIVLELRPMFDVLIDKYMNQLTVVSDLCALQEDILFLLADVLS